MVMVKRIKSKNRWEPDRSLFVVGGEDLGQELLAGYKQWVTSPIVFGKLLKRAQLRLPYGSWTKVFAPQSTFHDRWEPLLPMSERTAQRLMKIAGNEVLADPTHVSVLPVRWSVLYELTALSLDEIRARIANGTIHSQLTRSEVISWRRGVDSAEVTRCLRRLHKSLGSWPDTKALAAAIEGGDDDTIYDLASNEWDALRHDAIRLYDLATAILRMRHAALREQWLEDRNVPPRPPIPQEREAVQ